MVEANEEKKELSHGIIVIWLDLYIGDRNDYDHLKAAFASNIDPTNLKPTQLFHQHGIDDLFQLRIGIPCQLRTFADPESCLLCIRESLNANKRIYFITSDSFGRTILPHIVNQYPEEFQSSRARISFYIFTYFMDESLDWLYDYIDYALVFSHEADLLSRLVDDIALYYTETGRRLLNRNTLIDVHQALIYFEWAYALYHDENRANVFRGATFIQTVQDLIQQAQKKIEYHRSTVHNEPYSQNDIQRSLDRGIFIYCSEESDNEATQLLSTLQNLTKEQGLIFHNSVEFVAQLQSESRAVKYHCPIVISSKKNDQMKILEDLSSLASVNHIYFWNPDEEISTTQDEQNICENFPKIRSVYSEARALTLEWTGERASICEKMGALCTKNRDSHSARMCYQKAIELNTNLATFIKEK